METISIRAKVEHPFRVIKQQFSFTKVRYRGLAKNTAQIVTLFALSNRGWRGGI
jgi:IS5 family transposase